MRRLLPLLVLLGCGNRDFGVDNPLGAFSMRYEPVIDAGEGMELSFGSDRVWALVDGELTVYDPEWTQIMRVGDVSSVAAVLDVGVWISGSLVLRSEAGGNAGLVTLPAELGIPRELRRGDGGELWVLGETSTGGAVASSLDTGETWQMRATELTAGSAVPETLELRDTLGGIVVVVATSTAAGASTTWKITGSGAEAWQDGAFLTYPAARLPDGWVGTLAEPGPQFDGTRLAWAESWSPDAPDGWQWTHGVGQGLDGGRPRLTALGADDQGVVYAHDTVTLYRTTTPFSPEHDQTEAIAAGPGCEHRHRIDWSVTLEESARDTRVRNGLGEDVLLYELFAEGTQPLADAPVMPDGAADIVIRLESWLYVTDLDGRCLSLVQGKELRGREVWLEP